ncbi:DUF5679 domain-containing protein [Flavivirga rizhaonensis]|uniref:DUF5679 domain-containing protein n=1 Tax=Flavivirga rizhaonensis TaxID=2559571 RepID=A0A4S1E2R8_9FLAO|nr:DUF5679 domain-containing protein [Flavivirga rizhaonensis]TGV04232.1 hypothetical protein EM932_03590 [Flavivirga rizhaonensis]
MFKGSNCITFYLRAPRIKPTFIKLTFNRDKTEIMEGYCVKCKSKKEIKNASEVTMKNGRKAMKGSCPTCGTGMFRILGKS